MDAEDITIGVIVNPIAGMGGRVGLKGTDGVLEEAIRRGAKPVAAKKMGETLTHLKQIIPDNLQERIRWLTCGGPMGEESFRAASLSPWEVAYDPDSGDTTAEDTRRGCRALLDNGARLIVFCGGDGTARDVHRAVNNAVPILGIPAGVKMHSGVFAVTPEHGADIILEFVQGRVNIQECEIMDLDEERYRKGEWNIKLYGLAKTAYDPSYVQSGKMMVEALDDEEVKGGIADYIMEIMDEEDECLYILGPGGTLHFIGERIGIDKTLLGVDCVYRRKLVGRDMDETGLLRMLDDYPCARIIVSPIGAQGFIFGRGNLQISPSVLKRVGMGNVLVVSTPAKLSNTPVLRVDMDDEEVKTYFKDKKYLFVITQYHTKVMRRVEI